MPAPSVKLPRLGLQSFLALGLLAGVSVAATRIHLRVQTTLVGYEIAQLKSAEAQLLEERSGLKMQLSKLTTKKHLMLMTESIDGGAVDNASVALK